MVPLEASLGQVQHLTWHDLPAGEWFIFHENSPTGSAYEFLWCGTSWNHIGVLDFGRGFYNVYNQPVDFYAARAESWQKTAFLRQNL